MLTNFLYNYTSCDKDCLLGLIPNEKEFATLISPLNANYIWPATVTANEETWIKKQSLLIDSKNNVNVKDGFGSSEDWELKTGLSLMNLDSNCLTFSTKINIDTDNIGNSKVQLFKQGSDELNGLIDIYFDFNRETAFDGSLDTLVINVYYSSPSDSSYLNLQTFELSNIALLLGKEYVQLTIVINSKLPESNIIVYANNEIIGKMTMEISDILDLPFNTPADKIIYDKLYLGGNDVDGNATATNKLKMKNVFIWKRALSWNEIILFNKLV